MRENHDNRLLGRSLAMRAVLRLIERAAPTDACVLITGEGGTGKELAAWTLHERSPRRSGRFLAVNCGSLSSGALEVELFGQEGTAQARPGLLELADGGTLFLDEVTELAPELQVRLLRFLESRRCVRVGGREERRSDARVVAATQRSAVQAVRDGRLREDLLYRLAVLTLAMPTLRERGPEEIRLLASHFLDRLNRAHGRHKRLGQSALATLREHHWPGNVRELRNAVERAFILCEDLLELDPLPVPPATADACLRVPIGSSLGAVERLLIEATLGHHGGNKRRAAATLGCSVKTLYNKLAYYDNATDGGMPA
jgi:DNA-binding NtrC family response regulator